MKGSNKGALLSSLNWGMREEMTKRDIISPLRTAGGPLVCLGKVSQKQTFHRELKRKKAVRFTAQYSL